MPGRTIRHPSGYTAFVPAPLPPMLDWTPELVRALSDADRLIGRLAGEGGRLPNPHLLMRPFMRREAVLSSRIEGTQATLGELLAVEAGAAVDRSPEDLREVGNYVVALEYGLRCLKKLLLSLRLMRELHGKLMAGVRGGHATPGEFRRSQNWIGPPGCTLATASYVSPPPDEMTACLGQLAHGGLEAGRALGKGALLWRSDWDNRHELSEGPEIGRASGVERQAVGGGGGPDEPICQSRAAGLSAARAAANIRP